MLKNLSKKAILRRIAFALAAVLGPVCAANAAVATWDANPEPDVAGYRLSYGTQPGVHTFSINVGKVTSYQFNPPAGARYYVVVQAYNAAGQLSPKSAEVTYDVPLANRTPALAPPANQSTALNANVSLALAASDPDGGALWFFASGLPPGVSIDNATGAIAGIPLAKGTYAVTVAVTDGVLWAARSFTWIVTEPASVTVNIAPFDTTLTLSHSSNSAAEWLLAYTWPANRTMAAVAMKFNLSQVPANATIQSAILSLYLTASDTSTDPYYTMRLHQVTTRNPDIALATGWIANSFSAWTANSCCQGGFPMAQADISAARASTVVTKALGFKTWDATALARAWLASPGSNYGLLLNPDTSKGSDRFRLFASAQDPVAARRPFLRVTYTVPSTTALMTQAASTADEDAFVRVDGDFDGDGKADLGTYQAATSEWRIWISSSNYMSPVRAVWGKPGDVPVPADYDGDAITDVATYRPSTGEFHIWSSKTQQPLTR